MRALTLIALLALATSLRSEAREVELVHLAIFPGAGAGDGAVDVAVNGATVISALPYRGIRTLDVSAADVISIAAQDGTVVFEGSASLPGAEELLILSGGLNSHPLALSPVGRGAAFTDINPNLPTTAVQPKECQGQGPCIQLIHLAPIAGRHAQFGGPEVGFDLSCERAAAASGSARFRVSANLTYGEYGSFGPTEVRGVHPWLCTLNSAEGLVGSFSAASGVQFPVAPGESLRIVLAGDGVARPHEALVLRGERFDGYPTATHPDQLLPRAQGAWISESEPGRGILVQPIGPVLKFAVEYYLDRQGKPRWRSYVVARDVQSSTQRYFGAQYHSRKTATGVVSSPIADAELVFDGDLLTVRNWTAGEVSERRFRDAGDVQ